MSFNSLRNWVFLVSSLGIILGGFLGAQLGALAENGWGDLVGAITGIWLGGPIGALATFQILITRTDFDIAIGKARLIYVLLTFLTATLLLTIFSLTVRFGSGSVLLVFILMIANLALSYFNLLTTVRLAKK